MRAFIALRCRAKIAALGPCPALLVTSLEPQAHLDANPKTNADIRRE